MMSKTCAIKTLVWDARVYTLRNRTSKVSTHWGLVKPFENLKCESPFAQTMTCCLTWNNVHLSVRTNAGNFTRDNTSTINYLNKLENYLSTNFIPIYPGPMSWITWSVLQVLLRGEGCWQGAHLTLVIKCTAMFPHLSWQRLAES